MLPYLIIGAVVLIGIMLFMNKSKEQSFKNISVEELSDLMKKEKPTLIDVRTKREIAQGVIGKPLEIELGPTMQQKFSTLDKNKKYILYCRSGRRSAMASGVMSKLGFADVHNLVGGYLAWQNK
ncbi:MAG: rhodanese-like domain-containing protein [Saprospiraceae bacterium]|nr:rhodanese-like domain-containing protein [Saprospiraceae bacterium]